MQRKRTIGVADRASGHHRSLQWAGRKSSGSRVQFKAVAVGVDGGPSVSGDGTLGMRVRSSDNIVGGRSPMHYWPFLARCCARHSQGGMHR